MSCLIVISERDNVATTLEPLDAGEQAIAGETSLTVRDAIPSGHKIALVPIAAGNAVVKYGSAIGIATADIEPGAHVHTHNLASTRGRGDLQAAGKPDSPQVEGLVLSEPESGRVEGRLAEPSDPVTEGAR